MSNPEQLPTTTICGFASVNNGKHCTPNGYCIVCGDEPTPPEAA